MCHSGKNVREECNYLHQARTATKDEEHRIMQGGADPVGQCVCFGQELVGWGALRRAGRCQTNAGKVQVTFCVWSTKYGSIEVSYEVFSWEKEGASNTSYVRNT